MFIRALCVCVQAQAIFIAVQPVLNELLFRLLHTTNLFSREAKTSHLIQFDSL